MANCLFCGSSNIVSEVEVVDIFGDHYHLLKCAQCATEYLDPQPTEAQLQRAYGRDYYGEGDRKFNPLTQKVVDFLKRNATRYFVKRLKPNDNVLDIGCGDGSFLEALGESLPLELHGLEMEGESANRTQLKPSINLTVDVFKQGIYTENEFDAVALIHVFEHLPQPREVLKEVAKIVKPNGHFFIEIPNISSWQYRLFKRHWFHIDAPRHLHFVPPITLVDQMEQLGFELVDEKHSSIQFGPYGVQQSLLNKLGFKRDLLYEYLKKNEAYYTKASSTAILLMQLFHWFTFPLFVLTDLVAAAFKRASVIRYTFKKMD